MAATPELTDGYFGRLTRLVRAIHDYRYASRDDEDKVLKDVGKKLAELMTQIILDQRELQLREELEKYGEETVYGTTIKDLERLRASVQENQVLGDSEEGD